MVVVTAAAAAGGRDSKGGDNQKGNYQDGKKDSKDRPDVKKETTEVYGNRAGVDVDIATLFCLDSAATKHMFHTPEVIHRA